MPFAPTIRRFGLVLFALLIQGCSDGGEEANHAVEEAELERLAAIGYLANRPIAPEDREKVGAVVIREQGDSAGYQLLTEIKAIRLIDMAGGTVRVVSARDLGTGGFSEAEYLPDGRVLVVKSDESIVWLDREWRPVHEVKVAAHHDISVDGDRILTLTRRLERVSRPDGDVPMLVDYISILDADGTIQQEISFDAVFGHLLPQDRLRKIRAWVEEHGDPMENPDEATKLTDGRHPLAGTALDAYHANFVTAADRDVPGVCRKGDLLVSSRVLDLVAFIRPEESRIVWSWGPGELEWQHNPVFLPSGNLLIFDNGVRRKWSRVIELDPRTRTIVWEYHAQPKGRFYSSCCGSAEKLANGNVVVTDAERGRVFEVTPDREIVWDWWNHPSIRQRMRVSVLRSHRVPAELVDGGG